MTSVAIMSRYFSSNDIGATLVPACIHVLRSPRTFYMHMPTASDYKDSLVLLAIYLAVPALIISVLSGLIGILVILPVSLILGLAATWLWAAYLAWAVRLFCKVPLSTCNAFQICAYAAAPLLFSWVPLIGVVAYFWNLFLCWQGLVAHAKVGGGAALIIILAAFVILAASLLLLAVLLAYLAQQGGISLPELQPF